MKGILLQLAHPRGFRLFIKILSFFIGICLLFAVGYSFICARAMYSELEKQLLDTNINLLSLTDTTAEIMLNSIEKSMTAVSQNANIISAVIAPGLNRPQRNYDVVRFLNNTASNSVNVMRIVLYVNYDQTVFTSEGAAAPLDAYPDRAFVDAYHAQREATSDFETLTSVPQLFAMDDRLFYCMDFPLNGEYRNGTLFFEIDPAFYAMLNSQTEFNVFVYDADNTLLFKKWLDEPPVSFSPENFLEMRANGSGAFREAKLLQYKILYYYTADNGWLYFYPVPLDRLSSVTGTVFAIILPLFFISLLLSCALSSYLSHTIYRPIRRLTDLVSGETKRWIPSDKTVGEMEFLGMAYQDAVKSNTQLTSIINRSTYALLEKMFRSLLQGREAEPSEIEETLHVLNTPFSLDNTYIVFAFYVSDAEEKELSIFQIDLYRASLDSLVSNACGGACSIFSIAVDGGRIAMVASFEAAMPSQQVSIIVRGILSTVQDESAHLPCKIWVGLGKPYHSIFDLKFSYQEALEKLNYQSYLNVNLPQDADEENDGSLNLYRLERARQIAKALFSAQPGAMSLSKRVLDTFFTDHPPVEELRRRVTMLVDAIYEFTDGEQMDGASALQDKASAMRGLRALAAPEAVYEYAEQLCANAAEYFGVCNSRKKYRYVLRAKEYIDEHYMEATLSQNEVAENTNITSSYLSRLFKEYQHENFIDYLNELRIRQAEVYFTTTDLTIIEVGFKCGFSSSQNFYRVFKRYKQITPGQYREKIVNRAESKK